MNSPITFPPPSPALKLARPPTEKWAASLAEERRRLQEDQDALREREENLREYELRLRQLQAEIDASRRNGVATGAAFHAVAPGLSWTPAQTPADDRGLQAGWEKLHRARELLEAEQTHLRDDRIAIRDNEATMKRREEALAEREARLAEREALVLAAMPEQEVAAAVAAADPEHVEESAMSKITTAPFKMARAVLLGKKAS